MSASKLHVLAWLDAIAQAHVSTAAKAVALAMATHADYATGDNMRAGTARLAWMAGLQERQTRAMVGQLRDAGFIEWDRVPTAPGRARTYRLTVPDGGNTLPSSTNQRRHSSAGDSANGGTPAPQRRHSNTGERRHSSAAHQGPTRARPGDANPRTSPASETHAFEDDSNGTCLMCRLPQANRQHQNPTTP